MLAKGLRVLKNSNKLQMVWHGFTALLEQPSRRLSQPSGAAVALACDVRHTQAHFTQWNKAWMHDHAV